MPERIATCGDCGAQATIADGDWNSLQQKALQDWRAHHEQEVHDGQPVDTISVEPDPGNAD